MRHYGLAHEINHFRLFHYTSALVLEQPDLAEMDNLEAYPEGLRQGFLPNMR
jgi:hypothetical protein